MTSTDATMADQGRDAGTRPADVQPIAGMWPDDRDITGPGEGTVRSRAISALLAAVAGRREGVQAFRRHHLPGGELLRATEVETWLSQQQARDGRTSLWLDDVPLDLLQLVGPHGEGGALIPAQVLASLPRSPRILWVALPRTEPHDLGYADVYVRYGGVLDTLRMLCEELLKEYGMWAPYCGQDEYGESRLVGMAKAATFVLTGYAPLIDEEDFPAPTGSGRRQTDKHLQLVAFHISREMAGMPLAECLAQWNARYPQWRYKNTSNFGWDSREARRRLMRPGGVPLTDTARRAGRSRDARRDAKRTAGETHWTAGVSQTSEKADPPAGL